MRARIAPLQRWPDYLFAFGRAAEPFLNRMAGALVALLIAGGVASGEEECAGEDGESARVAAVTDGATLQLEGGLVVRLAGIAAPNPPLPLERADWPLAEAARAALAEMAAGSLVDLVYIGPKRDRYGRAVAIVAIDGGEPSLADAMLAKGLARVMPGGEAEACLAPLLATEREAREKRLGLWGDPYYAIRAARDPSLAGRSGAYDLVEGRVLSVGQRGRVAYLDFGLHWKSDFTAIVTGAAVDALVVGGRALPDLAGRRVLLRGWIEQHDGPSLRASQPGQIEVLGDGD